MRRFLWGKFLLKGRQAVQTAAGGVLLGGTVVRALSDAVRILHVAVAGMERTDSVLAHVPPDKKRKSCKNERHDKPTHEPIGISHRFSQACLQS